MFFVLLVIVLFFFQAEDGIRDVAVTGVQTCALPISEVRVAVEDIHGALPWALPHLLAPLVERRPVLRDVPDRWHEAREVHTLPRDRVDGEDLELTGAAVVRDIAA